MASDEEVRVKAGETFTLRLPAVPTAGYEWQETHDPATLELVRGGEFSPGASDAPGAGSEEAYRNTDASGTMHFPAWSVDAVEWLISERSIVGVGVDTLSLDPGNATAFVAHVAVLGANRFGIENLANLGKIRPHGATAFVGVIPWEEGSGGPARVVATW